MGDPYGKTWAVTHDLSFALKRGYIGEAPAMPKPLPNAIRVALGGQPLPAFMVYYYGVPDEALRARFSYHVDGGKRRG